MASIRRALLAVLILAAAVEAQAPGRARIADAEPASFPGGIQHVWVIVLENTNWSDVSGNVASAPYLNELLTRSDVAHATQYRNPAGLHPSEPNYVWMEAGTATGLPNAADTVDFASDDDPGPANSTSTSDHLVAYLTRAGITWKSYQEGIDGVTCPLSSNGNGYAAKHNPMIFFQDVTGGNEPTSAFCIEHVRPFSELATDLANDTVARYSFITPILCHDMHDTCPPTDDRIRQGDDWLRENLPSILASRAYANGGAVFITWDEGEGGDGPIGMIVVSPSAKGRYENALPYDHSSLLRTLQEVFGVDDHLLGGAADALDLSDLFNAAGQVLPATPPIGAVCAFRNGFAALQSLIPSIVGDCLEDEHVSGADGNVEQRTTGGLLVWREVDNWTAFTDGATTWLNGPEGLQARPNDQRFDWEQP